jgi:Mrp family chromosome partitioning ATPase
MPTLPHNQNACVYDLTWMECWVQHNNFEGQLAGAVADAVVEHLIAMKRLPESRRLKDAVDMSRVMLGRPGNVKVVGRDGEVQRAIEALTGDAGAAVLVGGPGEGKSTVAMEAGLELCRRGWFPGGAFVVDFLGEHRPYN